MATIVLNNGTLVARPRPSLEDLVDRLMAALRWVQPETRQRSMAKTIHDARRMRKAGDIGGALALFDGVDTKNVSAKEARWAYAEWLSLTRRRFGDRDVLVYSPDAGQAAALVPHDDGALEVMAALGMRWKPGKLASRSSLRGLKTLVKGGSSC